MDYETYIRKLRICPSVPDYDRLLRSIKEQAAEQPRVRLAEAGALAIVICSLLVLLSQLGLAGRREVLMSYVFEQPSLDGPALDYVLESGTI